MNLQLRRRLEVCKLLQSQSTESALAKKASPLMHCHACQLPPCQVRLNEQKGIVLWQVGESCCNRHDNGFGRASHRLELAGDGQGSEWHC